MTREEAWHAYVAAYPVEVSEEAIQNELEYIQLDLKHRMMYDRMSGGMMHLLPELELAQQADELREAAVFEAKEPLVVKDLVAKLNLDVTAEELEAEAAAIAACEGSNIEMLKRFFGEDLGMLRRDVLERKVVDWAVAQ